MTSNSDFNKILNKEDLTGKEAGKLVLQNNWMVDHAQEGFLSEKDIQTMKSRMRSAKYIEDYNTYISAYRIVDNALKDARSVALTLENRIIDLSRLLLMCYFDATTDTELPTESVLTTGENSEFPQTPQETYLLQELEDLHQVLEWRALAGAPEEIICQRPEEISFLEWTRDAYPEIWRQALKDILELLRSGKLEPVLFTEKFTKKLDAVLNKGKTLRDQSPIKTIPKKDLIEKTLSGEIDQYDSVWATEYQCLKENSDRLLLEFFRAAKKRHSKKIHEYLITSLEKFLTGSLREEDEDVILYSAFCSEEELYHTHLPEWTMWIEECKPEYVPLKRNGKKWGLVITSWPSESQIYKKITSSTTKSPMFEFSTSYKNILETLQEGSKKLNDDFRQIYTCLNVTEAVSEYTGIDFAEDFRDWIEDLDQEARVYNLIRMRVRANDNIPDDIKDAIQYINRMLLEPDAKTVRHLQERIGSGLGDNSWEEIKAEVDKELKG